MFETAPVTSPYNPPAQSVDKNAPKGFDRATSDLVQSREFTNTFQNADGSKTLFSSIIPLNVKTGDGQWVPVSTTAVSDGHGGRVVKDHPLNPQFAANASAKDAFSVSRDGFDLSFTPIGADSSLVANWSGTRSLPVSDQVTYDNVFTGVDVRYDVTPGSVKETLVLDHAPERGTAKWSWWVRAPGLTIREDQGGSFLLNDSTGKTRFIIPNPVMWDSSGKPGVSEPATANVDASARQDGADWIFTLAPDDGWLHAKDRVYPVSVDPTSVGPYMENIHAYKSNGVEITDGYARVGNSRDGGDSYWRTVLHYNYEQLFGKQVIGAWLDGAYNGGGTTNTYAGGVRWANAFSYNGTGEYWSAFTMSNQGSATDYALGNRVAQWVRDGVSGSYIMLSGQESAGLYTYKNIATALGITYKDYPTAGTAIAPSPANGVLGPLTPKVKISAVDPEGTGLAYFYRFSENPNPEVGAVHDSGWIGTMDYQVPPGALQPGKTYYWKGYVRDGYDTVYGTSTVRGSATWSFVTNTPAPTPPQATATPADQSVSTTLTPTLTAAPVTDVNGHPVKYQVRIASGSDGKTGALINSGWLTTPTWTVPPGTLQDGGAYTWVVLTDDGFDQLDASWRNRLQVNLRIGDAGPAPTDSAGPVTVNLANGNVAVGFTSPTVSTVGGPIGMSFSYNSQQPSNAGLTGSYYDVTPPAGQAPSFDFTGKTPVLVRTDSQVSFQWGADSPGPSLKRDNFMARWSGFVTPPTSGSYTFGVTRDNGTRLRVNNTQVIDQWSGWTSAVSWGTPIALAQTPVAFSMDYYDDGGPANVELWVRDAGGVEYIVPAGWFIKAVQSLPVGWSASTPLSGAGGAYASAQVTEASVVLTDASGGVHTYVKASTGGYTPPVGEYGVLSLDATGQVTLTSDDGTVYSFNAQGRVQSSTTPADALKPASPVSTYRSGTGQIDRVSDRLSAVVPATTPPSFLREVVFAYAGDTATSVGLTSADSDGTGLACPVPTGYAAPPAGALCRIVYPGHVAGAADTTQLYYDATGMLVRIKDPGDELTDFGYTSGRLSTIRDSLANDWLAADTTRVPTGPVVTTIGYDAQGRAVTVALPAPDGVTVSARPSKTYTYGAGVSYVDVAGIVVPTTAPSNGHARTVTFDSGYRQLTDMSASGLTVLAVWNEKDMPLSATDAQGRMSTTLYNGQDRAIDSYGPAPTSCFGPDRRPVASCPIVPAHSATSYDQGLVGLNAQYFPNASLTATPTAFGLGIGTAGGAVSQNWAAAAPTTGIPADNWSLRLTGLVTFPAAGTFTFKTFADDGTKVWIDDVLLVNDWVPSAEHWSPNNLAVTRTAGQQSRIRVEYFDLTGAARLELHWVLPDGTTQLVPGSALTPDYGLATATLTDDAAPVGVAGVSDTQVPDLATAAEYANPWLGEATATIVDPAGLNLRTETTFEALGSGYLRRTSKRLPAAVATGATAAVAGTTFAYYGDAETFEAANGTGPVCGLPANTSQSGFLRTDTGPTPAVGSAIVTTYAYDLLGRAVGTKRSGDSAWTCTTFDARGRTNQVTYPAYGTAAARTSTFSYTSNGTPGGDPLTSWDQDDGVTGSPTNGRVTTTTDLLGRTVTYTDVWGTIATTTYENLTGRVLSISTITPGAAAKAQQFSYTLDGQLDIVKDATKPIADLNYVNGMLDSVLYPTGTGNSGNGSSLSGIVRDQAGRTTGITWAFPAAASIVDQVVRAQSGRILTDTLTRGGTVASSSYSYDAGGRLVTAVIPRHTLSYAYASTGGCSTGTAAGRNGNRTAA
ncbi:MULTISPECIES: PA14 domain-containing protein, partial [unclassified Cryobacterium]|uniref:PA14 domain-containing protein n=1 Tax=unclassified Cryobacterium TaxID=2649013 RepID=UPI0018C91DD0